VSVLAAAGLEREIGTATLSAAGGEQCVEAADDDVAAGALELVVTLQDAGVDDVDHGAAAGGAAHGLAIQLAADGVGAVEGPERILFESSAQRANRHSGSWSSG
jgi:hypothetical protein